MQISSGKHFSLSLLFALLVLTFLVYAPGLTGDFIFDDYPNIYNNEAALVSDLTIAEWSQALSSGVATSLSRPLSMLTFSLNHYFTGLDPYYFKLTNLLIHLLICPGIYLLVTELLSLASPSMNPERRNGLALMTTAIWALHPVNVSSVLYIVQRMNQLSALMVVYTLVYYCRFRRREVCDRVQAIRMLLLIGLLMVIGVLFKENAILLVLYILAIEYFLLRFRTNTSGHRLFLNLFAGVYIVVPAVILLLVLGTSPESITGSYSVRDFTLWERLLTETRALWMYAGWVLMPDIRDFLFYYDGYPISRGILDPVSTLHSILGLMAVATFCVVYSRKLPILCFGIAFFLAGHALESTIISLEPVFEHRNYLPSLGLIFAGVYTLMNLPASILGPKPALIFLAVFLIFLTHGTYTEAAKWSNTFTHLQSMVARNPESHRANYSLGYFYNRVAATTPDNDALFEAASDYHRRAIPLDQNAIRSHVGAILADSQNNRPLDQFIVDQLEARLQSLYLTQSNLKEFTSLADCFYSGFCKFDKAILARFITALARNKVATPIIIQATLAQLGVAAVTVFNSPEDGLAILHLARNVRPELTLVDLQLLQLEIQFQHYPQARQLLAEAKEKEGGSAVLREGLATLEAELDSVAPAP